MTRNQSRQNARGRTQSPSRGGQAVVEEDAVMDEVIYDPDTLDGIKVWRRTSADPGTPFSVFLNPPARNPLEPKRKWAKPMKRHDTQSVIFILRGSRRLPRGGFSFFGRSKVPSFAGTAGTRFRVFRACMTCSFRPSVSVDGISSTGI